MTKPSLFTLKIPELFIEPQKHDMITVKYTKQFSIAKPLAPTAEYLAKKYLGTSINSATYAAVLAICQKIWKISPITLATVWAFPGLYASLCTSLPIIGVLFIMYISLLPRDTYDA